MACFRKYTASLASNLSLMLGLLLLGACASIQQPTGGPRDKEAPKILEESPKNFSTNFSSKKILIRLDEYIKPSIDAKEISISPSFENDAEYKIRKKTIEIAFVDTLEKNTTYTINFGKAIADYNEGNILKNYSYVFSTGPVLDSLSISGKVFNSITKEPDMEATVLLFPLKQDTLFGKKRASLFTTTDSAGNFKINNLRADTYRIYALKEKGGDRIYNSTSEEIAFVKDSIVVKANVQDTRLELFKEEPQNFKVLDYKLLSDGHFLIRFNSQLLQPGLKLLNIPELDIRKKVEFNSTGDSALMWLPEITFDTLSVAIQNSNENLDTVIFRRSKKDTYTQTLTISDNLSNLKVRQGKDLTLILSAPVQSFDSEKVILMADSIPLAGFRLERDSVSQRKYHLKYNWREKKKYSLEIEPDAVTSFSGGKNKAYSKSFTMDPDVNYGTFIATVSVPDTSSSYVVQLLDFNYQILKSTSIRKNSIITYSGYAPGKYRFRVIYDLNKNGRWDTGNVKAKKQPEPIWNYPDIEEMLPNFDIEPKLTIPPIQ